MTYGSVFRPNPFAGRRIIVTGGGGGIGRRTGHERASRGAAVALVICRDPEPRELSANTFGVARP